MKKNIVLIDLELTFIQSIYESKKINIEFLITDADDMKLAEIKDLYGIKNIITREKFHKNTEKEKYELDYEKIEKFKVSQLNSEYYQARFSSDANLKQFLYFNALSFWINFFNKKNISAIVIEGLVHGANYDTLALDVGKAYGIPGYIFDSHMMRYDNDKVKAVRSVLDYNFNRRIPLDIEKLGLQSIKTENYLFYIDKMSSVLKKKQKKIKDIVKFFLPSYSGVILILLKKFLCNKPICMHGFSISRSNILKNIFYVRKIRRFYDSISVEFESSKKYIFYALHFDPEASIMAKARFYSQLSIIRQLSQNLPSGWILYVKEHPDQFKFYAQGWWYFLISIHKYRTKRFYREILKLHNVRLIKRDTKSYDIIRASQAVSTINGNISIESINYRKSLILFGHQSTPFGLCKDIFKITSNKQCKEAINQIKSGFIPDYSDFNEVADNYLFELNRSHPNNVRLLIDYLVCEYSNSSIK